jgi:biotin carboxyl carrier protein
VFEATLVSLAGGTLRAEVDGVRRTWRFAQDRVGVLHLQGAAAQPSAFVEPLLGATEDAADGDGSVRAPMSGRIVSVGVVVGDHVERGAPLLTLEAMKLQSPIAAPVSGTVRIVSVVQGEQVKSGQILVEIEPPPD